MFNMLYRCPRTVARHENGPLHAWTGATSRRPSSSLNPLQSLACGKRGWGNKRKPK